MQAGFFQRRQWLLLTCAALLPLLFGLAGATAQTPFAAQIQRALAAFKATAQTFTGTQTFTNLTVTGTCTGCGGGGAPGGATTQVQFNDATAFAGRAGFTYDKTIAQLFLNNYAVPSGNALIRVDAANVGGATGGRFYAEATGDLATVTMGLSSEAGHAGTGMTGPTTIAAFRADYTENWNGGHVGSVIAFDNSYGASTYGGSVDNLIGFHAASNQVAGMGTATNSYGLLIDNQAGVATNNWAIKTGTGAVQFGDVLTTTGLVTSGSGLSVADVGAASCGSTAATIAGNYNSFEVTVGATSGTQCRVTLPLTAPVRWNCAATNLTTAALVRAIGVSTTTVDLLGVFAGGAVLSVVCNPR